MTNETFMLAENEALRRACQALVDNEITFSGRCGYCGEPGHESAPLCPAGLAEIALAMGQEAQDV